MAAITLRPVFAEMPVVLMVAAAALRGRLHRAGRFMVAVGALQFGMSAQQREMSLLGVIEYPERPAIWRMTGFAFLAETALVHIIVRMAFRAGLRRLIESQGRMALRAADDSVQAE